MYLQEEAGDTAEICRLKTIISDVIHCETNARAEAASIVKDLARIVVVLQRNQQGKRISKRLLDDSIAGLHLVRFLLDCPKPILSRVKVTFLNSLDIEKLLEKPADEETPS